ncbi:hypothetical protein ACRRTK_022172 [Alexandromys fortis]
MDLQGLHQCETLVLLSNRAAQLATLLLTSSAFAQATPCSPGFSLPFTTMTREISEDQQPWSLGRADEDLSPGMDIIGPW